MNPAFEVTRSFAATPAPGTFSAPRRGHLEFARYSLLLGPLAVLLALGAVALLDAYGVDLPDALLPQIGILGLCLAFVLPRQVGRLQRLGRAAVRGGIDRCTGLCNRAGLMAAADELFLQTQRDGGAVSMIVIEFNDLREVHDIYGADVSRKLIARIVRKLFVLAGPHGVAGRTGAAQFTVVMPVRHERALRTLQRVLGKPARIEFDAGDSEIVLVPDLALESVEPPTEGAAQLWRELCRELAVKQKDELRRQHYLRSERVRHSRPMSLPPRD